MILQQPASWRTVWKKELHEEFYTGCLQSIQWADRAGWRMCSNFMLIYLLSHTHSLPVASIRQIQQCNCPPVIHSLFLFHAQLGSHVVSVTVVSGIQSKHLWGWSCSSSNYLFACFLDYFPDMWKVLWRFLQRSRNPSVLSHLYSSHFWSFFSSLGPFSASTISLSDSLPP